MTHGVYRKIADRWWEVAMEQFDDGYPVATWSEVSPTAQRWLDNEAPVVTGLPPGVAEVEQEPYFDAEGRLVHQSETALHRWLLRLRGVRR